MEEGKNMPSTDDYLQKFTEEKEEEEEVQQGTAAKRCASPAAFHGMYCMSTSFNHCVVGC